MSAESPKAPELLTREQIYVGMRVKVESRMRGVITALSDAGVSIHWDGAKSPDTYDWDHANFMERDESAQDTRKKCLEAYAVSLGANIRTVRLGIEALLLHVQELPNIEGIQERNDLDPETISKIEEIGEWLLHGSTRTGLSFPFGAYVVNCLRGINDEINPQDISKLRDMINYHAGSKGTQKFDDVMTGQFPRILTREELITTFHVVSGSMHGDVVKVDDYGVWVRWNTAKEPKFYDWEHAKFSKE